MMINYISLRIFKNKLTGEFYTAENRVRAWLYFYEKAKSSTGMNIPTINDITDIL